MGDAMKISTYRFCCIILMSKPSCERRGVGFSQRKWVTKLLEKYSLDVRVAASANTNALKNAETFAIISHKYDTTKTGELSRIQRQLVNVNKCRVAAFTEFERPILNLTK